MKSSSPSHRRTVFAASCIFLLIPFGPCWSAQSGNQGADVSWAHIQALARPDPVAKSSNGRRKTPAEFAAEISERRERAREAAQEARDFYSLYPDHPKAAEARKIEALCALRGSEAADQAQIGSALAIARTYRLDSSYPVGDRFEVALAMDRLELSANVKTGFASGSAQERRGIADNLRAEFGNLAALHDYYMEIARGADSATAIQLATAVNQVARANGGAKARATEILDRAALVETRLNLALARLDGGEVDLSQPSQQPTILMVWHPSDPESLGSLTRHRASLEGVTIIYLALSGTEETAREGLKFARVAGIHCHAPAGISARRVVESLKNQYMATPHVYVFNPDGTVSGWGPTCELGAMLTRAAR
jgi:hypothetical protein